MHIRFHKDIAGGESFSCTRKDGSELEMALPAGCAIHDLAHFAVEMGLGISEGYWGKIAVGFSPEDFSLSNDSRPFAISTEGYRAEYLATLAQTEASIGFLSPDYVEMVRASAVAAGIPFPEMPNDGLWAELVSKVKDLYARWTETRPGERLDLVFHLE